MPLVSPACPAVGVAVSPSAEPGLDPGIDRPAASSVSGDSAVRDNDWMKIDFHLHASEDPRDELDHSATELLRRAHALGFGALAITLHDHVLTKSEVFDTARELGILLIPAAEMRLEGADVLVLNITEKEARGLRRLRDLDGLRKDRGSSVFTLAAHPCYVLGGSIGARRLVENIDLFDAVEWCHFYTRVLNPNRRAAKIAAKYGKPLLATSDVHRLDCFGSHYSLVRLQQSAAEPTPEAIFNAIRAGEFRTVTQPWPVMDFVRYAWWIFAQHELKVLQARLAGH